MGIRPMEFLEPNLITATSQILTEGSSIASQSFLFDNDPNRAMVVDKAGNNQWSWGIDMDSAQTFTRVLMFNSNLYSFELLANAQTLTAFHTATIGSGACVSFFAAIAGDCS
jgi:hypothetical protein